MEQAFNNATGSKNLTTRDHLVTGEEFELVRRGPLGLLQTEPVPQNLERYYQSTAYISHTDGNLTFFEKAYQLFKSINLRSKRKLLSGLQNKPGKLLDFGAGTGDFLSTARKAGWEVFGVEPSENARSRARHKGIELCGSLETIHEGEFDAITLWHVLEHVKEPHQTLAALRNRLKPKGVLLVAVPNHNSFDAGFYGAYWAAYDTPRHLWHFTRASLRSLGQSHGLLLVKEKPQWLDAFYVSWLSEKYRRNPIAPARAILVAAWSNLSAIFTGESSSRIFIFRKADKIPD